MSRSSSRQKQSPPAKRAEPTGRRLVLAVILLAILSAAFMVFVSRRSATRAKAPGPATIAYEGLRVQGRALGDASAPVTIVEYSDFQCPYCKVAANTIVAPLKKDYVAAGRVRFQYQPVAILGPESLQAAQAALCAEEQGRFWPYHDRLFASQAGENRGAFNDVTLRRLAADVGLDQTRFNTCLDRGQRRQDVMAINREANTRGVTGTPTFFVNGVKVVGAVPYAQIRRVIEGMK